MKIYKIFSKEELLDLCQEGQMIDCEPWKWGTNETYVFEYDNAHWMITIQVHSQDGWQIFCPIEAVKVSPKEKIIIEWVAIDE